MGCHIHEKRFGSGWTTSNIMCLEFFRVWSCGSITWTTQPTNIMLPQKKNKGFKFQVSVVFFTNSRSEMSKSLTSKSSGTTSRRPTHFTLKIRSPLTLPFWGPHFQTPPVISYLVGGAITILKNMKYICVLQFSNFHGTKEYKIYDGK